MLISRLQSTTWGVVLCGVAISRTYKGRGFSVGKLLRELGHSRVNLELVTDSRDVRAVAADVGVDADVCGITGVLVALDDSGADYADVWLTESARPWDLWAVYDRPQYYGGRVLVADGVVVKG